MKKVLLIDVSNLFFRSFYSVPSHFTNRKGIPSNALYGVVSSIFSMLETLRPDFLFIAQDLKGGTFRHEQIDGYKAGRPEMPEELALQLPYIFDFFSEVLEVPLLSRASFEADDILATVAEKFRGRDHHEVLILSADQDLLQLVGDNVFVLSPQRGGMLPKKMDRSAVEEKIGVSPERVADYKGIAGDSSDALVGVPGIGPVGAQKILHAFDTLENALQKKEDIPGKPGVLLRQYSEQALLTKRIATLCRDVDLPEYSEEKGIVPQDMPKNLLPFLQEISSQNLITRAKKVFGEPQEQMNLF